MTFRKYGEATVVTFTVNEQTQKEMKAHIKGTQQQWNIRMHGAFLDTVDTNRGEISDCHVRGSHRNITFVWRTYANDWSITALSTPTPELIT